MTPKLKELISTLRQLFLFDRADLDFGLYRIMNAHRVEVDAFLQTRLPEIARDRLGAVKQDELARLQQKVREARQEAEKYGAPDPDKAQPVLTAHRALVQASDLSAVEDQVYSLLVTFFSRYYEEGDFITRRRYSHPGRERYMIPYDGEEVKLVWANMDQYYIKSDEFLRDYRFRLPPLPEGEPAPVPEKDNRPAVLFKLVEAEIEKDNRKTTNGERRFTLAVSAEHPVAVSADGKLLTIPFAHTEQPKGTKQSDLLDAAERALLQPAAAQDLLAAAAPQTTTVIPAAFADLLRIPVPNKTDPKKTRTLLRFHLDQYAARNTYDYFIHKDLGGFFTRELDYFLKSEVLEIEDLIGQPSEAVDLHLRKVRAVRDIAQNVIVFLANLENFQKKLWLKKKFVVETHWCLTLDRVPETLYPEIAANPAQWDEWKKLGFLSHGRAGVPPAGSGELSLGDNTPPEQGTVQYLNAYPFMVIDTALYNAAFKQKLLASIEDIDAQTNGLLIHSENFQALNLLQERYREQVKCVYTDPPYNTRSDGFPYKDGYLHSSWVTMMRDRLASAFSLLTNDGNIGHYIDENELVCASTVLSTVFGEENRVVDIIWKNSSKNDQAYVSMQHEYFLGAVKSKSANKGEWTELKEGLGEIYAAFDGFYKKHGDNWKAIHEEALAWYRQFPESDPIRDSKHYSWMDERGVYFPDNISGPNFGQYRYDVMHPTTKRICKEPASGWRYPETTMLERIREGLVHFGDDETTVPNNKTYLKNTERQSLTSIKYRDGRVASKMLTAMFGGKTFTNPKDVDLSVRLLKAFQTSDSIVVDYFAGTGTTGHAVINLNREDTGRRKYILVEMGDYFDTVLKPRIQKVVFSKDWKDGKPTDPASGVSHCFKYIRLESYEDTLNNLILHRNAAQQQALALSENLNNEYLLGYFLDTETADSPSLLNVLQFADPWNYALKIAEKAVGESRPRAVDLIETFNYLIGIKVSRVSETLAFVPDGKPQRDADGRLRVKRLRKSEPGQPGSWKFQTVAGTTLAGEKSQIVWRTLSADRELDSAVLEAYLQTLAINTREQVVDVLYVNGDHTLENLATTPAADEVGLSANRIFKVRMIETEFRKRLFAGAS